MFAGEDDSPGERKAENKEENPMKKTLISALLGLVLSVFLLSASAESTPGTITVTGSATIVTEADTASISLGVSSTAKEAGEASQANARLVDQLLAALKDAGIEEKDISTNYYYVSTRRDYSAYTESGEYPVIGYEVNNTLTVVIHELERAGEIIDLALASGANSCDGLSFSTTKAGTARDEALTAAIQEGKRRAEIVASAAGKSLGEVLTIHETYTSGGPVFNAKMMAEASAQDVGTSILADGLNFTATVEMTFEMK